MAKLKLYYGIHFVRVASADAGCQRALEEVYKGTNSRTFVYIPFKVLHSLYEQQAFRKACNVCSESEVVSKFACLPYSRYKPSGVFARVYMVLSRFDPLNKQVIKKKVSVTVCLSGTSVPSIINGIINVKTVTNFVAGEEWTIEEASASQTRRYIRKSDDEETESEDPSEGSGQD